MPGNRMIKRKSPAGKIKKKPVKNPLNTITKVGLVLALIFSWSIVFFLLFWGKDISAKGRTQISSFSRDLIEYDLYNTPERALEGINPEQIERRLSALHKKAKNAEDDLF